MISSIRKYQDSWVTKSILFLTALSFMSLFGVSGYLGSAGKNRPVIKVDKYEILQNDFMVQFDKQSQMAKNMLGDAFNDDVKANIMTQLINKDLTDLIMARTADKLNVSVSDGLVRAIIHSRAEFMNDYGQFDINKMRRTLSMYGVGEAEYIRQVKLGVVKQHLIDTPTENMQIPNIMAEYMAKAQNIRKTFKYIKLDVEKTKIDRKISDEEVAQYYQDFILEFTNPETRDVEFIALNSDEIAKTIVPTDEEINEFYQNNIDKFETPERRRVLQMVLGSEEEAIDAKAALDKGQAFNKVAKDFANQTPEETDFGLVAKDMLVDEISSIAFSAPVNKISGPVQSDYGWHIFKVTEVKPMTKVPFAKAKAEIVSDIRKEQAYDAMQAMIREIDDKIGAGATLAELAKEYNVKLNKALGLAEDGSVKNVPQGLKDLVKSDDFTDTAFSYNIGEISQIIETDEGVAVLAVTNVVEAQPKAMVEVRGQIEKMWAENERNAIVQEITNDVMADLDAGDTMEDISSRFGLNMKTAKSLKRDDSVEGLDKLAMFQLFQEPYYSPKIMDMGNVKIIVMSEPVKFSKKTVTEQEILTTKAMLNLQMFNEYSQYLTDSFAKDYDVRIKYRLLGLGD